MPTVNLQPTQQDNQVTLLKKFLQAINLYWGGALPSQQVNVDVTVNEEGDTIILPAIPTVSTVEINNGNVGGYSKIIRLNCIGAAAAYSAGDVVGPVPYNLDPFRRSAGQRSAILQSVTVTDASGVGPDLRIIIGGSGAIAAAADNAPLSILGDSSLLQVVDIAAADWVTVVAGLKAVSIGGIGKVVAVPPGYGDTVYAAVVATTGFTATTGNGITVQFGFLQD